MVERRNFGRDAAAAASKSIFAPGEFGWHEEAAGLVELLGILFLVLFVLLLKLWKECERLFDVRGTLSSFGFGFIAAAVVESRLAAWSIGFMQSSLLVLVLFFAGKHEQRFPCPLRHIEHDRLLLLAAFWLLLLLLFSDDAISGRAISLFTFIVVAFIVFNLLNDNKKKLKIVENCIFN